MEKRKHERAPLAFPIRFKIGDVDKFTEQFAADISAGGVFLPMNCPPPEGSVVDVEFYLQQAQKMIRFQGKVVRSVPDGTQGSGTAGMALEFIYLEEGAKRFIDLVVKKYKRTHATETVETSEPVTIKVGKQGPSVAEEETRLTRIDLRLLVRFHDEDAFHEGQAHTLLNGEIFILSPILRPAGSRVHLQVFHEYEDRWIAAEGRVARTTYSPGTEKVPYGPGVDVEISEPSVELLRILRLSRPGP